MCGVHCFFFPQNDGPGDLQPHRKRYCRWVRTKIAGLSRNSLSRSSQTLVGVEDIRSFARFSFSASCWTVRVNGWRWGQLIRLAVRNWLVLSFTIQPPSPYFRNDYPTWVIFLLQGLKPSTRVVLLRSFPTWKGVFFFFFPREFIQCRRVRRSSDRIKSYTKSRRKPARKKVLVHKRCHDRPSTDLKQGKSCRTLEIFNEDSGKPKKTSSKTVEKAGGWVLCPRGILYGYQQGLG